MNKSILITGGAGFIGSHLCEKLVKRGHHVICLDNLFTSQKQNIAHLLSRPNEVIPIPRPERYSRAGQYPTSYRISYDEAAGEYRVALTGMATFR